MNKNQEKNKEQKKIDVDFQSVQNVADEQSFQQFSKGQKSDKYDRMKQSYEVASFYSRKKLEKENPDLAKALEDIQESNVIVVEGSYDRCQLVLELTGIPHKLIPIHILDKIELNPEQTVFINCPGRVSDQAVRKLATFVKAGGLLVTTDWALSNVLEKAFPEKVRYNQNPTGDEVVRIIVADKKNPIVSDFLDSKTEPLWWLEGSSYPIQVLDKENVTILIYSNELKEKYGESPVIIEFEEGKGKVVHMISHFYLQRTETRDKKDKVVAGTNIEKEVYDQAPDDIKQKLDSTSTAEFSAAQTSVSFIAKNIAQQKKKYMDEEK